MLFSGVEKAAEVSLEKEFLWWCFVIVATKNAQFSLGFFFLPSHCATNSFLCFYLAENFIWWNWIPFKLLTVKHVITVYVSCPHAQHKWNEEGFGWTSASSTSPQASRAKSEEMLKAPLNIADLILHCRIIAKFWKGWFINCWPAHALSMHVI